MAEAHPVVLRQRVVQAYERGEGSFAMFAKRFRVGEASVNWWSRSNGESGMWSRGEARGGNAL